jgi:hydrogenase expression/formation protein HypE
MPLDDDTLLPIGKLPPALLAELLAGSAATAGDGILVGPAVGEDAAAIEIESGVLVAAADPVTMTSVDAAGHCAMVNANDVAVMGALPRWFTCTVLLPPGVRVGDVRALFDGLGAALLRIPALLVGGHTEVTPAVNGIVVSGQMLGMLDQGPPIASAGVRAGDVIVQIGPAPIEGAAVLAALRPGALAELPEALRSGATGALEEPGILVVAAALAAAARGAHAMHDPTEGGLSAGLHELAEASRIALVVEPEQVLWFEPGRRLCEVLGLDPWGTLASGTLLAAFARDTADEAARALALAGHAVAPIARAEPGSGVWLTDGSPLHRHDRDQLSTLV